MSERLIAPEIPELLTYRSVERRILRACKTIRSLPDKEAKFLYFTTQNSMWKQTLNEWEAYGATEIGLKFRPTPFDVSDCLIALSWLNSLDKPEFRLIWWRSFDNVSFALIAGRIGRSDETARRRYEDAIRKAWNIAIEKHYYSEA